MKAATSINGLGVGDYHHVCIFEAALAFSALA